jgi:hypothetical protein
VDLPELMRRICRYSNPNNGLVDNELTQKTSRAAIQFASRTVVRFALGAKTELVLGLCLK